MVLIGISFDNSFTCSCEAPDHLLFQRKATVVSWFCNALNLQPKNIDELIVVNNNTVMVLRDLG
jgi:hypothetical protein